MATITRFARRTGSKASWCRARRAYERGLMTSRTTLLEKLGHARCIVALVAEVYTVYQALRSRSVPFAHGGKIASISSALEELRRIRIPSALTYGAKVGTRETRGFRDSSGLHTRTSSSRVIQRVIAMKSNLSTLDGRSVFDDRPSQRFATTESTLALLISTVLSQELH